MSIRRGAIVLVCGFAAQFIFGMLLNLFVTIPDVHPGAGGANYFAADVKALGWGLSFGDGWALFVHVIVALVLTAGCAVLFIVALRPAGRGWRWFTGVSAMTAIGAVFNGLSFIDYGHDFSSMIMAGCWLVAVGSLVAGLLRRADSVTGDN